MSERHRFTLHSAVAMAGTPAIDGSVAAGDVTNIGSGEAINTAGVAGGFVANGGIGASAGAVRSFAPPGANDIVYDKFIGADRPGVWEDDLNWSTGHVPDSSSNVLLTTSASIQGSNGINRMASIKIGSTAELDIVTQDAINKSTPVEIGQGGSNAGTILIALQSELSIDGAFKNTGKVIVGEGGATDASTADYLDLSVVLSGGGAINLHNGWVQGSLTNTDNTISGYGYMGNGFLVGAPFHLINQGVIDANGIDINGIVQNLVIQAGATVITNTGLLEATNPTKAAVTGGLDLFQDSINNIGGTIAANGVHTHVDLTSTTVNGGTLETTQGGVINFDGTSLLNGKGSHPVAVDGSLVVNDDAALNVAGTINLVAADNGNILLNSTGSPPAQLVIAQTGVTLDGGGSVTLGGFSTDQIVAAASGATLTVADATINGGGQIGDGNLVLVNQSGGVIDATSTKLALTIDTGAHLIANAGLLEATGGGDLIIASTVNNSAGGTISASNNSAVTLQNALLIGGTLETTGSGQIGTGAVDTLDARTVAIANQGLFRILNGSDVTLEGTFDNTGTIAIGSPGNGIAIMRVGAATTLTGGGALTLSDIPNNNFVIGLTASSTLTNVDNVISGAGTFGDGQLTLVNKAAGIIDANGVNALILDVGTAGSVTSSGLIEATGTGGLTIADTTVTDSSGGVIEALAHSTVTLQSATVIGGVLETSGSGTIRTAASDTLDARGGGIANKGTFIDSSDVTLEGSLSNTGAFLLGDSGTSNSFLRIGAATTLSGGGALTLSDVPNSNFVIGATAATVLTNIDNVISGAGNFGDGQLTLINKVHGVINANGANALVLDTGSVGSAANAGLIEATGAGGLVIASSTVDNSGGGTILAANGATVSLSNTTLIGGLVESLGSGAVQLTAASTLDGRAQAVSIKGSLNVLNNLTLTVEGAIDNTGKISIEDAGTFTALRLAANTTLSGGGKLALSDSVSNFVIGASQTTTLTNVDNTIFGAGQLSNGQLRLINQSGGVINASGVHAMTIESGAGQTATNADINAGLIKATGSGGLTISLTTFDDSAGGTILAANGSSVTLSLSEVIGGTLNTSGTGAIDLQGLNVLDGVKTPVKNQGLIQTLDSGTLEILGTLNNTGTVTLNGTGHPSTFLSINAVLSGGGALTLTNSSENVIEGATSTEMLKNVDNTISGAGHLGNGQMVLINQSAGVIDGTFSTGLVIDTGTNVITNSGLIEATAGGVTTIDSAAKNNGVLEANGGVLTVNAAITGTGHLEINGGTLDLSQAGVTNAVQFAGTTGALQLDHSLTFSGSVSGLSKTGSNSLDLSDIGFVKAREATFVENGAKTGGILSVTDGTHTAHIALTGDYSGSTFTAKSDGHGGTLVATPAGPVEVGSETLLFNSATQSTGASHSVVHGFDAATDRFDFPFAVTRVDAAVGGGALSQATFDHDLSAAVGAARLGAHDALLFHPTSGDLAGHTLQVVDANGMAGYQAGHDFVLDVTGANLASFGKMDFI